MKKDLLLKSVEFMKHIVFPFAVCTTFVLALSASALAEDNPIPTPMEVTDLSQASVLDQVILDTEVQIDPAEEFKAEVLKLVNEAREKAGLAALTATDNLGEMADIRAEEAASSFSHTRPDGTKCFSIFSDYALTYRSAGENLAYGYDTPQAAFKAWMASPTHKANILSARYTQIGIGYFVKSNGKIYCSELFCTPKLTFKGFGS